jgi:hypothetical protein
MEASFYPLASFLARKKQSAGGTSRAASPFEIKAENAANRILLVKIVTHRLPLLDHDPGIS